MPNIFISYSRKDSREALALAEQLRAEGMEVWIDLHGLELASSWTSEIVLAIEQCAAFVLLLSQHALGSKNVQKELLIASESGRPILPLEIEHVKLTTEFKYALSGIQRAPASDIEGVFRSLAKLGIERKGSGSALASGIDLGSVPTVGMSHGARPHPPAAKLNSKDSRKKLLVLPFADLSQNHDHAWFADGLTEELIDTLSNIKSLRVIDRTTSMGFKSYRGTPQELAQELGIRYFIEGSVRHAGDTVKITAQVLDVESEENLPGVSHKGTMNDIFEIQEDVARKIAKVLELRLTKEESEKLSERGTENAEAYQLYLESRGYFQQQSKESMTTAISLLNEVLKLDENFFEASMRRAYYQLDYYRLYGGDISSIESIESMLNETIERKPNNAEAHARLAYCFQLQDRFEEAEREAKRSIELDPEGSGMEALAFVYAAWGKYELAAPIYAQQIPIRTFKHKIYFNLYHCYSSVNDQPKRKEISIEAIPEFERWLKLHPDDFYQHVCYCVILFGAGRLEDARTEANKLRDHPAANGKALYNLACFYFDIRDKENALACLHKAIAAGFRSKSLIALWKQAELFQTGTEIDEILAKFDTEPAKT